MNVAKHVDGQAKTMARYGVFSAVIVLLCVSIAYAETPSKESVLRLLATQSNENLREVFYQAIEFAKENSPGYDASLGEMILSEATSEASLSGLHDIRVSIYQKHYTQQDVDEEIACNNSPAAIKWNEARPQIKEGMHLAHERWQVRVARQILQQYADESAPNDSTGFGDAQGNLPLSATPSPESVRRFLSVTEYSKESTERKMEREKRRFLSVLGSQYPDAPIGKISDMYDDAVSDEALEQLSDEYVAVYQNYFAQQDIDKLLACYGTPRAKIRHSRVLSETFKAARAWTIDLLDRIVQKREMQPENSK